MSILIIILLLIIIAILIISHEQKLKEFIDREKRLHEKLATKVDKTTEKDLYFEGINNLTKKKREKSDIKYTCAGCIFLYMEELGSPWECLKYNKNLTVADYGIFEDRVSPFPYCKCKYLSENDPNACEYFDPNPKLES